MFIIAKYASDNYPEGRAPIEASIADTYSVRECGVERGPYVTREQAKTALDKLTRFNPSVCYGILELQLEQ